MKSREVSERCGSNEQERGNFVQVSADHGADLKTGAEAEAEASDCTAPQAATWGEPTRKTPAELAASLPSSLSSLQGRGPHEAFVDTQGQR